MKLYYFTGAGSLALPLQRHAERVGARPLVIEALRSDGLLT